MVTPELSAVLRNALQGDSQSPAALRQLDYHLVKLQQFDQRQSERVESLLRESLELGRQL